MLWYLYNDNKALVKNMQVNYDCGNMKKMLIFHKNFDIGRYNNF